MTADPGPGVESDMEEGRAVVGGWGRLRPEGMCVCVCGSECVWGRMCMCVRYCVFVYVSVHLEWCWESLTTLAEQQTRVMIG
jgi:hypothetical protein